MDVQRNSPRSRIAATQISGRRSEKRYPLQDVRTVGELDLPVQTLRYSELAERHSYLKKLPIDSYEKAVPKLLIGLNNLSLAVPLKKREGFSGDPVAAKTRLGWTVFGSAGDGDHGRTFHVCECEADQDLHNLVKGFFAVESLGISAATCPDGEEDARAKEILQQTTVKCADGRYETGLLWRYDFFQFPPSFAMAEKRLKCLERRLSSKPEVRENLEQQIAEYQVKGYAHKATERELQDSSERAWYLPLGIALNPRKPGKVRITWDAAAEVKGVSLNSMLIKGPDLLTSLPAVLCRFRQRQVCVTADIREMYHQIRIREEDRQSQRFLWRANSSQQPEVYVMDVATFGSTCSPASAQYVKNVNAKEWENDYPEAAVAIVQNHYVDDYLDSRDTVEEMSQLAIDVRAVHAKAGFELKKWVSNSAEVLRRVGEAEEVSAKEISADKSTQAERVLGMAWTPACDEFTCSLALPVDMQSLSSGEASITKRDILRFVMSLFDPLGFISNFLVHGKILIQDLWRCGVTWDEPIPEDIRLRWQRWIEQVSCLDQVRVSRCYFPGYDPESLRNVQLHVFVDASEEAFACVAYFRIIDRGQPRCAFVASKAKVAPLKALSVPRLELQAAVIGTRMMKSIVENHTIPIKQRFIWSDSSTVLSWVRSDSRKYRQYVAVRIGEILELSSVSEWRWVPTKLNVADEATKWGKGPDLGSSSRWFNGPQFLYEPEEHWPQQRHQPTVDTAEELRSAHTHREIIRNLDIDYSRFSKWERLWRSVAYLYHFVDVGKPTQDTSRAPPGFLTQEDLQRAERALWRFVQAEAYPDEVAVMMKDGVQKPVKVEKQSRIYKLSPFADEFGVLRVGGRIGESKVAPYDAKFPIILPRDHYVTHLVIDWYHRRFGHQFGETVVNEMRQRFHISNLRTLVRKFSNRCQWCLVYKAVPKAPEMAPLPEARITPYQRPFSSVGLDYFGPYMVRIGKHHVKRWAALFTCLVIRAVHVEPVASLSTESCKFAVRRFIGRRGAPGDIFTDNGTNFLGASKELAKQLEGVHQGLAETFTDAETKWHFIPPASPHMGGAWERMVRSIKSAMESINRISTPTDEVFHTILVEAESMVNSRPLTYIPLENFEQESLTPNHFLLLSSSGVKQPAKTPTDYRTSLHSDWNKFQETMDQLWARWIKEYLPTIARRTKWFEKVKPMEAGDVVFVVDGGHRNSWTRGRVMKVIRGKDGQVRQAEVQTNRGILRRAVTKLAVVDVLDGGKAAGTEQPYGSGNVGAGL